MIVSKTTSAISSLDYGGGNWSTVAQSINGGMKATVIDGGYWMTAGSAIDFFTSTNPISKGCFVASGVLSCICVGATVCLVSCFGPITAVPIIGWTGDGLGFVFLYAGKKCARAGCMIDLSVYYTLKSTNSVYYY